MKRIARFTYYFLFVCSRLNLYRLVGLRRCLRLFEEYIIRRYAFYIFDVDFYVRQKPTVQSSQYTPLRHFALYGAKENINPSLLFDIAHYRERWMKKEEKGINPVVHFILVGQRQRFSPSPYFDYDFYEKKNPDIAINPMNSFRHFICHGVFENRMASEDFDPQVYFNENPDVANQGASALIDAIRKTKGLFHAHEISRPYYQVVNESPADLEKKIMALPQISQKEALVDIIVPVYRGKNETLSCLWHILKAQNETGYRVIVVDDFSPERDLSEALVRLDEKGAITLIKNKKNLGFVKSVNIGMQYSHNNDVVLLNSDTEVYGNWIDRLYKTACAEADIATVTPFTNNGTIASYPSFNQDNPRDLEISFEELDRLASSLDETKPITIPTCVGFCVYIKRTALNQIGFFDEETFGRGYGEENDFSLRAQKLGWRDVLAPNIFVRHFGSMSFQNEKAERVHNAMKAIGRLYPHYHKTIQNFIKTDPLHLSRSALDKARLVAQKKNKNVLIISHSRGGGTEQHVQQEVARFEEKAWGVFRMQVDFSKPGCVKHHTIRVLQTPNLRSFDIEKDKDLILGLWNELSLDEIHVHHFIDFGGSGHKVLSGLFNEAKIPWTFIFHDYLAICPRINLVDQKGVYCGEPHDSQCNKCLKRRGSEFKTKDIVAWRRRYHDILKTASSLVVPDFDVSDRLSRYWPDLEFTVRPHEHVERTIVPKPSNNIGSRRIRAGAIGAISTMKGLPVLIACSEAARHQNQSIDFVVIGFTENDEKARKAGLEITGPYLNEKVLDEIENAELDVIFIPSTWPETYSYTLSIALRSGLPIMVFDLGAQARRLESFGCAFYQSIPLTTPAVSINEKLIALKRTENAQAVTHSET